MSTSRRDTIALAWLAVVAAAAALSLWVTADDRLPGEVRAMREVQGWTFPGHTLSDAVRAVTTTWLVVVLGTLLALWLAATGARREALALLALMFALPLLQAGLKDLVDRPRPPVEMFDVRGSVTSESFPSGHVMGPTVLYGFLLYLCAAMRWPRAIRLGVALACLAVLALTGVVNIWLGVHWPSDVAGGYLWGLTLLLPAIAACEWRSRTEI